MKKVLKNQKGLTLVELLAVIVILGIIAAIAVPAIANIIDNSRKDAHVANAESMYDAARLAVVGENLSSGDDWTFYATQEDDGTFAADENTSLADNRVNLVEENYLDGQPENPSGDSYGTLVVYYDGDDYYVNVGGLFSDDSFDTWTDDADAYKITDIRSLGRDIVE